MFSLEVNGHSKATLDCYSVMRILNFEEREVELALIRTHNYKKAIASVFVTTNNDYNSWILWINDFVITREFKPSLCVKSGLGKLCVFNYDISSLLNLSNFVNFRIKYTGTKSIVVNNLVLFGETGEPNYNSFYEYKIGPKIISDIKFDLKDRSIIKLLLLSGERQKIALRVNGEDREIKVGSQFEENELVAEGEVKLISSSNFILGFSFIKNLDKEEDSKYMLEKRKIMESSRRKVV
jgi:hypothetical protein